MNLKSTSPGTLSSTQVETYWRDGFVKIDGLLPTDRVEACVQELDRLSQHDQYFGEKPEAQPRTNRSGEPVFDRLEPVAPLSPFFEQLSSDSLLVGPITQLLGKGPALFKEKLIFKPPGTGGYLAHQDYAYWEHLLIPADDILTLMVAFDAADAENGALELFRASHHSLLPAPRNEPRDVEPAALGHLASEVVCCEPGDAVVFHSLVPHRSGVNEAQVPRRVWLTSWNAGRWGNRYVETYGERLGGYRPLGTRS